MGSDRRVRYTKMVLEASLIKFLEKKPVARISVKEICEDADINRATYYAHYTDQFDQLKQIEAEFIDGINSYLADFVIESPESDIVNMVGKIFEYVIQNRELCRVLLGANGDMDFQENLIRIVGGCVLGKWREKSRLDIVTAEYMLRFIATGSIGIISSWLSSDNSIPAQDMAELVVRLANKGTDGLLEKQ